MKLQGYFNSIYMLQNVLKRKGQKHGLIKYQHLLWHQRSWHSRWKIIGTISSLTMILLRGDIWLKRRQLGLNYKPTGKINIKGRYDYKSWDNVKVVTKSRESPDPHLEKSSDLLSNFRD